jgi:chromate transporter
MTGLKPATIALIAIAAISLATPENFIDWKSFVICIVAFVLLLTRKVGPFSIIGLGAVAGLILY